MSNPIDLYIENLKRLTGVSSDTELAKKLALSKQAIAAWRRRQSVPLAQQRILTTLFGPEAAFNEDIGYAATLRERTAILSAFLRLFDKYRHLKEPGEIKGGYESWAQALLSFETDMERLVRLNGWLGASADGKPHVFSSNEISRVLAALVEEKEAQLGLLGDMLEVSTIPDG